MKRKFIAIVCVCFLSLITKAQTSPPHNVQFQTPEVSSFNRNIETPVSLFTGIPNISIPLYEIKTKDLNIPVTLNYTGGGIKVEEEATWVGLGWNLSCGGQISRKQRGAKDEQYFMRVATAGGYAYSIADYNNLPHATEDPYTVQRIARMRHAKDGFNDYMPDEFYYNLFGYSGRFMFSQAQNKFLLFPKEDLKIDYTLSNINAAGYPTSDYHIDSWDLKLPDGINVNLGTNTASTDVIPFSSATPTRTSWNINNIQTPHGSIFYYYTPSTYSTDNLASETYNVYNYYRGTNNNYQSFIAKNTFNTNNLSSISFPGGHVEFITANRIDMPGKLLSQINVRDNDNVIIKTIEFVYSYFSGNFNPIEALSYISNDYKTKRLRLDKIKISGTNTQVLEYNFDYYSSTSIPGKYSFSQDYWGFFNGATNSTLIPKTDISTPTNFGAERRPDPGYNQVFSLKSIQYPEGGKTEFIYECNTARASAIPSYFLTQDSYSQKFYTGGIRIKGINYYTGDGKVALKKQYDYRDPLGGQTSGRLLTLPKYYENTMYPYVDMATGETKQATDIRLFSSSRVPMQTTGGAFLGYEKVTEQLIGQATLDTLKTIYSYPFWDGYHNIDFQHSEATLVDADEWLRGKPASIEYLKNGQPIKQELFEYNQISPHLTYSNQEDYIEEINTDFLSRRCLDKDVEDFYDILATGTPIVRGFLYDVDDFPIYAYYPSKLPYFKRYTGFDKPLSKKTITIDEQGNHIEQTEKYFYGSTPTHYELTKKETTNSTGQVLQSNIKYPADMGATAPYPAMVQQNKLNPVVEESLYKGGTLVTKSKTDYNNSFLPANDQLQIGSGPMETKASYGYDINYNLAEVQKTNDVKHIYLWGERGYPYPVAEVVNANQIDVAYTSFETPEIMYQGAGGWSFIGSADASQPNTPVGKRCYPTTTSTAFTKQGLTAAKTYKVSYWSKTGQYTVTGTQSVTQGKTLNGWTFFEHKVTGVASLSVSGTAGYIDELKLCPADALMTTYNYTSLGLLTYQCDANNKVTYYEYDGLGRLQYIKDEDKNILKQIAMNYRQPLVNNGTVYKNTIRTKDFTKDNCVTGGTGSVVAYTVSANTYSSTISQEDADSQAQNDINLNGQAYSNAHGNCIFYNVATSGNPTRNNCSAGYVGTTVIYPVAANTYSSTISQADADSKAQNAINTLGQSFANTNGSCVAATSTVSANYNNQTSVYWQVKATNINTSVVYTSTMGSFYNGTIFSSLPSGMYTIVFSSQGMMPQAYPIQFTANGGIQKIQPPFSYNTIVTFNNVIVTAGSINPLLKVEQTIAPANCLLSPAAGWTVQSSSIYPSGATMSFAALVTTTNNVILNSTYTVGTITGGCTPSGLRTFTVVENGRTWAVSINSTGAVSIQLTAGSPPVPGATITLNGTYSL